MRVLFFIGMLFISFIGNSQYTIIETGRPKPFVERNAQEIGGRKMKVKYEYEAYKTDAQVEGITAKNAATFERLEKNYGKDWRSKLEESNNAVLHTLNAFIRVMKEEELISNENLVYFTKAKCGKWYTAEIYPAIEPENRTREQLVRAIRIREKGDYGDVKMKF